MWRDMTFRRRPSLGLDQALYEMPATYFKCFQVETRDFNSQPLNLYFWREDQNFHRFHQLHTGVTRDTMILGSV